MGIPFNIRRDDIFLRGSCLCRSKMFFSSTSAKVSDESLADLGGKVAIVTGANTGIGYATVQILYRKGANIYLAARDESRVNAAIEELRKENPTNASLHWLKLDLADPQSIKQAVDEFLLKETRLDILVNNAAIGAWKHTLRDDGVSDVMMVNHVGHFALTEKLLPTLKATAKEDDSDVRIVNVSSMAHSRVSPTSFLGKENFAHAGRGDMHSNMEGYGYSKLANILHIKELQRRLDQEGNRITCIAIHPGTIRTEGTDKVVASVPYLKFIAPFVSPLIFGPMDNGGRNVAFAVASKEVREHREKYKAAYLTPTARITQPSQSATDERLAKELYETSHDIMKELGI